MTRPGSHRGAQPDPTRRPSPHVTDIAGRLLSGFGSPEGKVAAGRGVLWQDTDPGGAGKVYRKSTASGNTGWVELGAAGGGGGGSAGPIIILERTAVTDEAAGGAILWNATVADTSGGTFWTSSPTPEGLFAPIDGIYKLTVQIEVYNDGTGFNLFNVASYANGNPADRQYELDQRNGDLPTLTTYVANASIDYVMAAGDYVEVHGNSAGGVTYTQTTTHQNPAQPPRVSWQQIA